MGKSRSVSGAAVRFINAKFLQMQELTEEQVVKFFAQYSALGLADMLIEAERKGGLTRDIIVANTPTALRDDEEVSYETLECFWQVLVFLTRRFKWAQLPGMRKVTRSARPQSTKGGGRTTIKSKVIAALGGKEKAPQTYKELHGRLGTTAKVVDYLIKDKGVEGLTLSYMENLLVQLRRANAG